MVATAAACLLNASGRRSSGGAADVTRPETLRSILDFEIDHDPLLEFVEIHADQTGTMEENFLAVVAANEPETAIPHHLRNRPTRHAAALTKTQVPQAICLQARLAPRGPDAQGQPFPATDRPIIRGKESRAR
jgi:hypothetical protein